VSLKIKLLEAKQTDPESRRFKKLRILGQYIVLLYNRALRIRLRDMYSDFLNEMLKEGQEILRPAFIELEPKGGSVAVKLITDPKAVVTRQNVNDAIRATDEAAKQYSKEDAEKLRSAARKGLAVIFSLVI
jgi:hypothetical protein